MTPAQLLVIAAAAAMLLTARRQAVGAVESGGGVLDAAWRPDLAVDDLSALWDQLAAPATGQTDYTTAARNVAAFLAMIQRAEGTAGQPDPYRVTYGYRHTIGDMSGHPADTGEWGGELLPDAMCQRAGFSPGCRSTAAGAYQIIRPTWQRLAARLGLRDFGPEAQDLAAAELLRERGALGYVERGDLLPAVRLAAREWASLPGSTAGQGQRSMDQLAAWYSQAGGAIA